MVDFSSVGKSTTPKNYIDFLRPAPMVDASNIFKKLQLKEGLDNVDAVTIASNVAEVILQSKASELGEIWDKLEKKINNSKPLATQADSDVAKLNTALGLIYSAMEKVDTGDDIRYVRSLRNIYSSVKSHIHSRFLNKQEGREKRMLQRSMDTIDNFFDRVTKRFNQRVNANEIAGPSIEA